VNCVALLTSIRNKQASSKVTSEAAANAKWWMVRGQDPVRKGTNKSKSV
jgi:hypothetical protein